MGKTVNKPQLFASWLRGQMIQNKFSQRALGKVIDPEQPERGRRQVLRHLSGEVFPQTRKRRLYLDAFGLDGDPFTDEEDDSEQAVARELADITSRLARLQKRVTA